MSMVCAPFLIPELGLLFLITLLSAEIISAFRPDLMLKNGNKRLITNFLPKLRGFMAGRADLSHTSDIARKKNDTPCPSARQWWILKKMAPRPF